MIMTGYREEAPAIDVAGSRAEGSTGNRKRNRRAIVAGLPRQSPLVAAGSVRTQRNRAVLDLPNVIRYYSPIRQFFLPAGTGFSLPSLSLVLCRLFMLLYSIGESHSV